MTLGPVVERGACDWCGSYALLVEHELEDKDTVHICSVCEWLSILQSEIKDANDIGKDMV